MNFALVLTNLAGGGAERSMLRLAGALAKRGHTVRMLLLEDRVEHAVPAGIQVEALAKRAGKGLLGKWSAAAKLKEARKRLGAERWITVSTLPFADEVALRAKLPDLWCRITNTLSAEIEELGRRDRAKAERRLDRYRTMYEGAKLVAVSQGVADDLRAAIGLKEARIARIYNGFDLGEILQGTEQPEPDVPHEPFVLHVGRFSPQKRHDLLLDAWKRAGLPMRLVLLAASNPELERMIEARGLQAQVTIAGFRPNPYPWMRAAELLVLTSDREGMPNVLVEALACGTRVLSTDCPSGPREVLRGDLARWLVPPGDEAALAEGMRAVLAAPRPGPAAVPEDFTEARMAAAYEALSEAA